MIFFLFSWSQSPLGSGGFVRQDDELVAVVDGAAHFGTDALQLLHVIELLVPIDRHIHHVTLKIKKGKKKKKIYS